MSEEQDKAPGTSEDGGQKTDDSKVDVEELLKNKEVQSVIDQRVTQALKTAERKATERERAAYDKAKREAEESKLLEDGKINELYERERQQRAELEAKLSERERTDKISALLDKKEITDPDLRKLFLRVGGELSEVDALVDSHKTILARCVEKEVNERLKTADPPPSKGGSGEVKSRSEFKDETSRAAWINKHGLDAYKKLAP